MIADLAPKLKRTMVGRLLKRFEGRAMRMKDRGVLVGKVLSEPELFARVLSHDPYVWRVLADRYWLEGALERKDEIMSFLSRQKVDEPLRIFREEFDRFMELAGCAPRLPMRTADINPQLS